MKILSFTLVLITGGAVPAAALSDYPAHIKKYEREYHSVINREDHKIRFGYYPYYFSNAARGRHSYSAIEKGHYRDGRPDKPWPFSKEKFLLQRHHTDPTRVLTSGNPSRKQRQLQTFIEQRMRDAQKRAAEPRVNDSRDLDAVIREHKWDYQSKDMRDAVERDPHEVRADPTDYFKLFQDN